MHVYSVSSDRGPRRRDASGGDGVCWWRGALSLLHKKEKKKPEQSQESILQKVSV